MAELTAGAETGVVEAARNVGAICRCLVDLIPTPGNQLHSRPSSIGNPGPSSRGNKAERPLAASIKAAAGPEISAPCPKSDQCHWRTRRVRAIVP